MRGPSWTEVIASAFLSVVLGVLIGAALLIAKPTITAKEFPKELVPGAVYFLEGSRDSGKARQVASKRKTFVEGGSVAVIEDELNALVAASAPPASAIKPGEKPAVPSTQTLEPGMPNFRIRGGELQVGVPITLNALGLNERVIAQARGIFVRQGTGFVFEPRTMYLGSCPLQRVPFLSGYVRKKILAFQTVPADLATAWSRLATVSIDDHTLKLGMP